MPEISYDEIIKCREYIRSLKNERYELTSEVNKLREENELKFRDLIKYEKEIEYLKQRNKELRQKTWIQVYDENIKLAQELEQYKFMLKSIENFIGVMESEKR